MLTPLLSLGSRWTLVGGKGGVGKTTCAAALAIELAGTGQRVLVLSTDPAHSLGDALETTLGSEPASVPEVAGLEAMEIDPRRELDRFLSTRQGSLLRVVERGTYLERADVEELAGLAAPGLDELAALFRLLELAGDPSRRLVIDTAPTGHTLRLLDLPRLARGWLGALQAMEEKHRAVALALAGAYRPDEAAALLEALDADLGRVEALLADPARTRFALVTTSEPVVLAETRRYQAELEERGVGLAGVVVNRAGAGIDPSAAGRGMIFVPPLTPSPVGVKGLRRFATSAAAAPPSAPRPSPGALSGRGSIRVDGPFEPPFDRRIYLVGGKGGVGKSTAAAALALHLARSGERRVLLLSVDPAGSLGDLFGIPPGEEPTPVPGAPGVCLRQLDAPAAWDAFRTSFHAEAERLFAGLLAGGGSATADERVVRRLIDLAPPGVDELVALLEMVDLTEDPPYDALVLDTAPTGHLLRLLEMPAAALEWAHALLRLLLKYREVVPLGEMAEQLLRLSRSLRALRGLLGDARQTWLLAVALPEALSIPETVHLLEGVRAIGIEPGALLVNRLLDGDAPLEEETAARARALLAISGRPPAAAAPALERGPRGADELLRFAGAWRLLV